jgi:hypothetical protein
LGLSSVASSAPSFRSRFSLSSSSFTCEIENSKLNDHNHNMHQDIRQVWACQVCQVLTMITKNARCPMALLL